MVRLDWLSIHVDFGSGALDSLFGELLRAVEVMCQAFRKGQPTREHTSLSTTRWKMERCPIEDSSSSAQTREEAGDSSGKRASSTRVEVATSLSDKPLEAIQYGCRQKLFVGGGTLADLGWADGLGVNGDDSGEGLETSFQVMVTLAAVEYPVMIKGGVVLVGYETVLVLVRSGDN